MPACRTALFWLSPAMLTSSWPSEQLGHSSGRMQNYKSAHISCWSSERLGHYGGLLGELKSEHISNWQSEQLGYSSGLLGN